MKVEVNEDSFEALLAYDDLFWDYFNAFLQLPAFPQPLYYNRLTGTFQEVEDETRSGLSSADKGFFRVAPYAPSDEERERTLEWAKTHRLPVFLRTRLFLEYKLCKLLTRPLDERHNGSRLSSRGVRGYSRQTVSFTTTSTSLAHSRTASYDNESDFSWPSESERAGLFKYLRPGSRCISLPPMLGLAPRYSFKTPEVLSVEADPNQSPTKRKNGSAANESKPSIQSGSFEQNPASAYNSNQPAAAKDGQEAPEMDRDHTKTSILRNHESKSVLKSTDKKNSPRKKATIKSPSSSGSNEENVDMLDGKMLTDPSITVDEIAPGRPPSPHSGTEHDTLQTSNEENPQEDTQSHQEGSDPGSEGDDGDDGVEGEDKEENEDTDDESGMEEHEVRILDEDYEPSIIDYDDAEEQEEERTESQLRELEGKHKMTLQEMKEHILGSILGMESFKDFLCGTVGADMFNFWLDCELFRDNMSALGENGIDVAKTNLFRTIQDKYRFKLTPDAQEQIKRAQGNMGLSESVFTRTQYDVLRRVRSYWVPRFLIHQEVSGGISYHLLRERRLKDMEISKSPTDLFLPSISLVQSLPVRPDSCIRLATARKDWNKLAKGGKTMEQTIRPGELMDFISNKYVPRPLSARFQIGLACDREAGGPFQRYLERQEDGILLANLKFWQDVTDYGTAEDRSADRLLRIGQAWNIFAKYIVDESVWNIGLPPGERDFIHSSLLMTSDFVEASTFERAKNQSVKILQREWLHYLKDDLKTFLKWRDRIEDRIHSGSSRFSSASRGGSGDNARLQVEQAKPAAITKNKKESDAKKKALKEKKKKQAAMQRKIMRQVKARQASTTRKPRGEVKFQGEKDRKAGKEESEEQQETGEDARPSITVNSVKNTPEEEQREGVTFKSMLSNRTLMNIFRNYCQDYETKEVAHALSMFFDIDAALKIPEGYIDKRNNHFKTVAATYFDPSSKKAINLSHDVLLKLSKEGHKPSAKTMESAQKYILPQIEEAFQGFWSTHVEALEEQGLSGEALGKAVDMAFRSESTQSLILTYKRRRRGKPPQSGQMMPNAQDKTEFQAILIRSGRGPPPTKILAFHRYLIEYGDKESMPLLEKDLLFHLEVQRMKEAFNSQADIAQLKTKIEIIVDCFLDSPLANNGVMIDVPYEISSKVLKNALNFLQDKGKDPHNASLFDEAQHAVFKEMIPYWASFTRRYQEPKGPNPRLPSTKYEKKARERLKKFVEMKEPKKEFKLPSMSTAPQNRAGGTGVTFSLSDGLKWKTFDFNEDRGSEDEAWTLNSRRGSTVSSIQGNANPRLKPMQSRSNLFSQESGPSSRSGRIPAPPKMEVLAES